MKQSTNHVLMVRPAAFGYNEVTAQDNAFQHKPTQKELETAQQEALIEFDQMVTQLKAEGVDVTVAFDTPEPKKPDAIFPNNWFTTHEDGKVILYPVKGENRRWERRRGILELLREAFTISDELDFSHYEEDNIFLEGTGSMILDKAHRLCYAAVSERTDLEPLQKFSKATGYELVIFHTQDKTGSPIYHTNVMMSVATHFVVICLACISDEAERLQVVQKIQSTGKTLIDISLAQVSELCGNVLEVTNSKGELILVMSERAYKGFTEEQRATIEATNKIIYTPIDTIENLGGGGTRCMLAEIFLPQK